MSTMQATHNGVSVDELTALMDKVKATPSMGKLQFRSKSKWINGAHSQSTFDSHFALGKEHKRATPIFLEGDEPATLLGTDVAANAAEAALHALTSCLNVTYAYNATAMGIDIHSLSFELEADTDLRGFMELDKKIRPGLSQIRVKVNLTCNGTPQQVKELHEAVARTSPLMDTFKNPVEIKMKY
ncbi:OsmC family protein [Mesoterricola silvestris]|uniref:Osmotically inducible protein C n=1 Tax=Mesoterricola silvestris TaxID=2927979 RepID=A0AA48GFK3_9BACT|nr:OsmC family protein [Mesoterricola silvestris]BDU71741.1 hypothetical protein METEAL_09150 [Mesoterricola silvestris]